MVIKRIILCISVALALTTGLASAASDVGISVGASVGSGSFTTTTDYTGEIQVSAPMLITTSGYYILTQDISSTSTAIGIMANNVTLDLNGHTITYGTGNVQASNVITYNSLQSGNVGHMGIACPADPRECYDYSFGWNTNGTTIVIKNGTITQGSGTGLAYSDALDLSGAASCQVTNVVTNTSCPDSFAVYGLGNNGTVNNNTCNSTQTVVSNRHAQCGMIAINSGNSPTGDQVYNNYINGGAQEGIKASSGTIIHDNLIRQNATVTNDYSIIGYGEPNVHVYNNTCLPYNGRGIDCPEGSSYWTVNNNYVEVRELGNNGEYTYMQTHGIKFDSPPSSNNHTVQNNVVDDISVPNGQPTPLNLGMQANSNITVTNSRFIAKTSAATGEPAWSLYMIGEDGTGSTINNNTFFTNDYSVGIPWDGANNNTIRCCDFRKVTSSDTVTFLDLKNADTAPSQNNQFIDCNFYSIDPKSYSGPYSYSAAADYEIGYSLALTAKNGGAVLFGATVTITCPNNSTITGTTDSNGNFSADLMNFKESCTAGQGSLTLTTYQPYTVTITKTGVTTRSFTVNANAPMAVTTDVTGSGLQNLCQAAPKRPDWGLAYNYGLSTDGTTTPTWSITAGSLPAGLSISSGAITGTPTQVGIYNFTVRGTVSGVNADKAMQLIVVPVWGILGKYNFTATSGGTQSWNSPSNWAYAYGVCSDSAFPTDQGKIANFSVDLTSDLTVNLGQNVTCGSLIEGDNYGTKYCTTFSNTGGYSITIDNGGQIGDIKCIGSGNYDSIACPVVLNDSVFVNGYWQLVFNGAISGTGGIVIRRSDNGAYFNAANTYTGDTVVMNSILKYTSSTAASTGSNFAVYANNDGTTQLILGNSNGSNANSDRIGDSKAVSLRGGSFYLYGNSSATQTENMGTLELGWGDSQVTVGHTTGQTTILQAASLSRLNGATAFVLGNSAANDLGGASKVKFTTAPTVIGGGGTTSTNKSIVPSLRTQWYDTSFNGSYCGTFLTYDNTNGLTALNPASDYFQADNSSGKTIMDSAATDNVRLIGQSAATDSITMTGSKTVNSLLINPKYTSGSNTYNINIGSGNTLSVTSGGVIAKKIDNNSSSVYFNTGTLAFGSNEGIFDSEAGSAIRVSGGLTGSGGITVASGTMFLQDTVKSYTGNTTVNHGTLYAGAYQGVNAAGVLPNSTTVVLRNNNGGYVNGGATNRATLAVQTGGSGTTNCEKIANLRGCGIINMGSTGKMVVGQNSSKGGPDIASGQLVLDGGTIYVGDTDTSRWDQDSLQIKNGSFSMATGTLNLNIGSLTEFGSLALITSGQNATISGGTLNLNILPGFVPDAGDSWNFLTTTSGSVTYNGFSSITTNAPGSFAVTGGGTSTLTVTYTDASGYSARPVPEPATLALLALGSLLALRRRNR